MYQSRNMTQSMNTNYSRQDANIACAFILPSLSFHIDILIQIR